MATTITTSAIETNAFNSIKKQITNTNELGKDQFLKLLITQMQYQDPLEPMKNENMIAQLAQFSALESMNTLEKSFEGVQAYNLIGKTVVKIDPDTLALTQGVVSGVKNESGKISLIIPDSNTNAVAKEDVMQAFSKTTLSFDQFKKTLFTEESLSKDKLEWNSSIGTINNFATALGYSDKANMPTALKDLWNKVYSIEIPLADVSYVYGS